MRYVAYTFAAVALATALYAGGFWLQLGHPDASAEAKRANAVLTVRAVGCANPAEAHVSGMAISKSEGKLQKIHLKLVRLSTPGTYAVARQWDGDGPWTLSFEARNNGAITSMLVNVTGDKFDRGSAKFLRGEASPTEVEALLAKR